MAIRTNLLPNPRFGVDTKGWSVYLGSSQLRRLDDPNWATCNEITTADIDSGVYNTGDGDAVVSLGVTYTITCEARLISGDGDWSFEIQEFDSGANNLGGFTTLEDVTLTSSVTRIVATHTTAQATVAGLSFYVSNNSGNASVIRVSHFLIEEGDVGDLGYFDGATTDTATTRYAWVGTAHDSASTATPISGRSRMIARNFQLRPRAA